MTRNEIIQRVITINSDYFKAKADGLKMKRKEYVKAILYFDVENGEEIKN